jgi:hypothetical protein
MANYFAYCFIFNLACCFAMPRIGDRLGKQIIRLVILVGLHGDSRLCATNIISK